MQDGVVPVDAATFATVKAQTFKLSLPAAFSESSSIMGQKPHE
ncbi:hypothetical protein [Propioniciclava tarda]|nr:hypothetical protein [Propioniciclava tarda]